MFKDYGCCYLVGCVAAGFVMACHDSVLPLWYWKICLLICPEASISHVCVWFLLFCLHFSDDRMFARWDTEKEVCSINASDKKSTSSVKWCQLKRITLSFSIKNRIRRQDIDIQWKRRARDDIKCHFMQH